MLSVLSSRHPLEVLRFSIDRTIVNAAEKNSWNLLRVMPAKENGKYEFLRQICLRNSFPPTSAFPTHNGCFLHQTFVAMPRFRLSFSDCSFFSLNLLLVFLSSQVLLSQETSSASKSKSSKKADTSRVFQMPTITVTTLRAENSGAPIAFESLPTDDIRQLSTVRDLPALLTELPSTLFYSDNGNAIGYSTLTLRGFDQRRIAVNINGIPQNDPEDHNVYWINFPDLAESLAEIQVQRGAGISYYGAVAVGGSVNLITSGYSKSPFVKTEFGILSSLTSPTNARPSFEKSPFDGVKRMLSFSSGEVNIGGMDSRQTLVLGGRFSHIESRGYRDNSWANLQSYFFSAVLLSPSSSHQINFFGAPIADGLSYGGLPKSFIGDKDLRRQNLSYFSYDSTDTALADFGARRSSEIENFSQPHVELLSDVELGDNYSFKNALFYYSGDGFYDYDASWADTTMLGITQTVGFTVRENPTQTLVRAEVSKKQLGIIPRLLREESWGRWLIGLEARRAESVSWGRVQSANALPADFNHEFNIYAYDARVSMLSAFAQVRFEASDELALTVDGQIAYRNYSLGNEKWGEKTKLWTANQTTDQMFSIDYLFFNPRIGATLKISESSSVFASAALTSREPRMSNLYDASFGWSGTQPQFHADSNRAYDFTSPISKPERLIDLELGYSVRKEGFSFSINGYWMEFFNELVKNGGRDAFGNPTVGNAPRTRHTGVELTGSYELVRSQNGATLKLGANATLSKNTIIEFAQKIDSTNEISLNGNPLSGFPNVMGGANITYTDSALFARVSTRFVGEYFSDNYGENLKSYRKEYPGLIPYADNRVDAFAIVDVQFNWTLYRGSFARSIQLRTSCTNVLNSLYAAGANGKEFFPGAVRTVWAGLSVEL